jgi:hypothetical protein
VLLAGFVEAGIVERIGHGWRLTDRGDREYGSALRSFGEAA